MKSLIILLIALTSFTSNAQEVLGYQVKIKGLISGENKRKFSMVNAIVNAYPAVSGSFSGSGSTGHTSSDYVMGSMSVGIQSGNGSGPILQIGQSVANPFAPGSINAWQQGPQNCDWIDIYNITQHVKEYYPSLIDQYGFYRIYATARYDKNLNQFGFNDWEFEIFVATDYHYSLSELSICESSSINLSSGLSSSYGFSNQNQFSVNNLNCGSGGSVSGQNYTPGLIVNDLIDTCRVSYSSENEFFLGSSTMNGEWYILGAMLNYNPLEGGPQPNYSTTPVSSQYNGWSNKIVKCIDTAEILIWNNPTISLTTAFPNPLYNNALPFVIENYVTVNYEDMYAISGPNVTYSGGSNNYTFNPNISQGSHVISVSAERGECLLSSDYTIEVQKWPGTPNPPGLNWISSFDDSTEQASFGNPPTAAQECVDNGVFIDCNYYFRHKWLCSGRSLQNDSIELFIANPQTNWNYEWKLSVNGFEQNLGLGVSKNVARRNNPSANLSGIYRERILFRAQNNVGLWSAWEYVNLDYPIYWYPQSATFLDKTTPGVLESTVNCHDGSLSYTYFNNEMLEDSVYSSNIGSVWNSGNQPQPISASGVTNYYSYIVHEGNVYNEGDTWNPVYTGNKVQYDTLFESAHIRRVAPSWYDSIDYCKCRTRDYVIESVKNPEIISVVVPYDTIMVQDTMSFSMTSNWGGVANWYVDSNVFSNAFVGNNVILYANGSQGWHNVYLNLVDQYGCSDDSLVFEAFYIKNYTVPGTVVDTIIFTGIGDPVIGIDAEGDGGFGGNLIITPNGDGFNDIINVLNSYNREYTITLFDRWGQTIYGEHRSPGTLPLIEMNSIIDLPASTYYYHLVIDGNKINGFIEILK